EQEQCAANIRRLLSTSGGRWVTPDIISTDAREAFVASLGPARQQVLIRAMRSIMRSTGRDLQGNYFASESDARKFFEGLGFEVETFAMVPDMDRLASRTRLWRYEDRGLYDPWLNKQRVWSLSLRENRS